MVDWILRGLTHATHRANGKMSSVKQVELRSAFSEKQENVVRAIRQEYNILKDLNHPNIVQFIRFEDSPGCLNLFLEYVPGVSIGDSLFANGKFPEELVRFYSGQIFFGLEYIHSRGIVHRDMKADNILVSPSGTCKISNFGKAETSVVCGHSKCRSPAQVDFWSAPEVLDRLAYNEKADIWGAGCLMLEMWTGNRPWFGDDILVVKYKISELRMIPPIPEDTTLSTDAINFRNKCLVIDPINRSTATLLRQHPYLSPAPMLKLEGRLPMGANLEGGLRGDTQTPVMPTPPDSSDIVEVRKHRPRLPGGRVPANWTVTWKCARQGDKSPRLLSPNQLTDQGTVGKINIDVPSDASVLNAVQPLRLCSESNGSVAASSLKIPSSLTHSPMPERIMKSADFITPDEHGWIVQMLDGPSEDLLDLTIKSSVPSPPQSPPPSPPPLPPPLPVSRSTLPIVPTLLIPPPPPPPLIPSTLPSPPPPLPPTPPTIYTFPTPPPPPPPPPNPPAPPTLRTLPMPPTVMSSLSPPLPLRDNIDTPVSLSSSSSLPHDTVPWHPHHPRPLPTTIRPLPPIPSQPIDPSPARLNGQPPARPDDQSPARLIDLSLARPHEKSLRVNTNIRPQNLAVTRLSVIHEAASVRSSTATPAIDSVSVSPNRSSSQTPPFTNGHRLPPPRPVIVIPARVVGESLPSQEPVVKRIEDCFPRHNSSVPIMGTTQSPDHVWKPSVQVVAGESKKRIGQPSATDSSTTMTRRNTSKLWITRYG